MELIKISHLFKSYKTSSKETVVLKDVSFTLPQTGLVIILGKSGSGKSTLLNLIGGIEKPTKGNVLIKDSACSPPQKPVIAQHNISFIFQHYNLLENETLFYNAILPALIQGLDKNEAEEQVKDLLERMGFQKNTWQKKVNLLSGGEKARIAILRALITNPHIILADEPTGALDEENSIKTFDILKKASEKRLVVLVTHNNKLANKYADRIISIQDGTVISDTNQFKIEERYVEYEKIKRKDNDWSDYFVIQNFKKRIKRNIVSIIGMTISMIFSYLLIGFVYNSNKAVDSISQKHFDYGSFTISKDIKMDSSDSKISLIKTVRPSVEEMDDIETKFSSIIVMNNYDIFMNNSKLYADKNEVDTISFSYVYDFEESTINTDLILENKSNKTFTWKDVYVNESANKILKSFNCTKPRLSLSYEYKVIKENTEIVDFLEIEESLNIVGVVDEFEFLSTPKIYFNYSELDVLFSDTVIENLSLESDEKITYKNIVDEAEENSELSSYSYRCFDIDYKNFDAVVGASEYVKNDLSISSSALEIKEALDSLIYAAKTGLEVFLVICITGSAMILAIFSYSSYNDDKKISSILTCLGASKSDIVLIFVSETLICSLFAFVLSTVLSALLVYPINLLLLKFSSIPNLISIPMSRFLGKKFFLPILFFIAICLLGILFTIFPILLSKRISIKKELADL